MLFSGALADYRKIAGPGVSLRSAVVSGWRRFNVVASGGCGNH